MALTETPAAELGAPAPDFTLPDADGRNYALADIAGARGLVVAFICNHCPYVIASVDRFAADARQLQAAGIGVAAIMPNDWDYAPDDAPEFMAAFARMHDFSFPYLVDETQAVARAFAAVCTPDYFGYDGDLKLRYRGRLDEGRTAPPSPDAPRELRDAMLSIADHGRAPDRQLASMGCSIKWRT